MCLVQQVIRILVQVQCYVTKLIYVRVQCYIWGRIMFYGFATTNCQLELVQILLEKRISVIKYI